MVRAGVQELEDAGGDAHNTARPDCPDYLHLIQERTKMPRKPNYNFERSQREKNKAAKKAERLRLKAEKAEARKAGNRETETDTDTGAQIETEGQQE